MVISLALLENAERCVNIGEIQLPFKKEIVFWSMWLHRVDLVALLSNFIDDLAENGNLSKPFWVEFSYSSRVPQLCCTNKIMFLLINSLKNLKIIFLWL